MNIAPDAAQAFANINVDTFTLDFSLGVAVPLKAGVRVYLPLNKRPNSLFTQLRVWSSKQVDLIPNAYNAAELANLTVTLVDTDGLPFVDNVPLSRFRDNSTAKAPRRHPVFIPRPLDTRSSYVLWNDNANPPKFNNIVLGLFYATP